VSDTALQQSKITNNEVKNMNKFLTKAYFLLTSDRADAKFDSSVQIVISFIIGAIILAVLILVFGTNIREWITDTVDNWFSIGGVARPT
jgi:riboflavin transporter FmnP